MATHSRELLVHFTCGSCNGHWSIGDPQGRLVQARLTLVEKDWFCPWCGLRQKATGPSLAAAQAALSTQVPPHPAHTVALTEPRTPRGDNS